MMSDARLRILSFSTVYPRPTEPRFGIFVRARLQKLAVLADVAVVAPVAPIEYGSPNQRWFDLSRTPLRRMDDALRVEHPRWFYPPLFGWSHSWWLARCAQGSFGRLQQEFPFQVIDAHFGHPEASAAFRLARKFGVPFTVTLRGNETFHAEDPRKRRRMAEALKAAARVIAVSEPLKDFAIELGVDPQRAVVIPNGIDSAVFHPRDRSAERQRLGMVDSELHILTAGYLIERKGHHRIVETLAGLQGHGRPVRLWIVGDPGAEGDFASEIRRRVSRCGVQANVTFVPAVPAAELACYMSACDLFCLATSREGWPNVVNEALACGAPVVATNVGGVPAMIPGPRFGLIVPPGDSAALGDALARALSIEWDRDAIARQGLSRSWEQVAKEVYEQLRAVTIENKL
jgi:glycosyltransferase involved in cell wall biosynthesis